MAETRRAAVYLDKGGTGKTTNAAHLAAALEQQGKNVLLIDLAGKQSDIAKQFGLDERVQEDIDNEDDFPNVATTMGNRWDDVAGMVGEQEAVERLVYETATGVDVIPAHDDLDGLDADLGNIDDVDERYTRFRSFLDEYVDPMDRWDVVLMDMPGLANNITYNGLWAAENVVTPVLMGSFEFSQAQRLQEDLAKIRENYGTEVSLRMLIANQYDRRTNLHSEKLDEFREEFAELLAPAYVVDSQQIRTATEAGRTLFDVPDDELSKTATDARDAFAENASELYNRLNQ